MISLREIANENVKVPDLIESGVYKLRKHVEQVDDSLTEDEDIGDDFENLYKGEISKSGTPILPSKRARKIPEKTQSFSKEDIAQSSPTQPTEQSEPSGETEDASVEELKDQEISEPSEDTNQG